MRRTNRSGIEFIFVNTIRINDKMYQYWTVCCNSKKHRIPKKCFPYTAEGLQRAQQYLQEATAGWAVSN